MKPLLLTWRLATPIVVSAYPLHLDGLIAFAMSEEGKRIDFAAWDDKAQLDLPLERATEGDKSCWKASALVPIEPGEHSLRFWTRKSDLYHYAQAIDEGAVALGRTKLPLKPYALKFDTQRGIFKQMFKFFPVRRVKELQAWCVGDEDRLIELLSPESGYITYLGSKRRMGFGRIVDFAISDCPEANELWTRRVMPWPIDGTVEVEAASSMPYHEVNNRGPAWLSPELFN